MALPKQVQRQMAEIEAIEKQLKGEIEVTDEAPDTDTVEKVLNLKLLSLKNSLKNQTKTLLYGSKSTKPFRVCTTKRFRSSTPKLKTCQHSSKSYRHLLKLRAKLLSKLKDW